MKDGARVLIPLFAQSGVDPRIVGVRRARAYKAGHSGAPDTLYRAVPTAMTPAWWFHTDRDEGITWCRDWSGPTARALKAAMALR